jgi:uncharacterized protein (DUF885 family)
VPGIRALVGGLLAFAAVSAAAAPCDDLSSLFGDYWEYQMRRDPTWATYLGDHRYGDRLQDLSEAAQLAHVDSLRAYLIRSQAIDRAALADADRMSVEIFDRGLERGIEGARFRGYLVPMSQQSGPHIGFPQIIESHPFDTVEFCDAYIARLRAFPEQVDQIMANMRKGMCNMRPSTSSRTWEIASATRSSRRRRTGSSSRWSSPSRSR